MGNESSSFTRSNYGVVGSQSSQGKPWLGQASNTLANISVAGEKVVTPLRTIGLELAYTSIDLERSILTGQPIDRQQFDGLNISYQMWTDEMVYVGDTDTSLTSYGLVNSPLVTTSNVVNGVSGFPEWDQKTPQEKLFDTNGMLYAGWEATGFSVLPSKVALPPYQFSLISQEIVSSAGSMSTLRYLKENSLITAETGQELEIVPLKWLKGAGVGGTDRMFCYTNREEFVRFPMVPIRRETAYYHSIYYHAPYTWAYGMIEFVYPETVQYADGI